MWRKINYPVFSRGRRWPLCRIPRQPVAAALPIWRALTVYRLCAPIFPIFVRWLTVRNWQLSFISRGMRKTWLKA